MGFDSERSIVVGILLHVANLGAESKSSQARILDSVSPIVAAERIWQVSDEIAGAFWIVAIGYNEIYALGRSLYTEPSWRPYSNRCRVTVDRKPAVCASFHDSPSRLAPPMMLRLAQRHIYRNPSGHCVPLDTELTESILLKNGITQ
jgi:hypothetical protein